MDNLNARTSAALPGRKLGIDFGKARIGVALCDYEGLLATPLETIQNTGDLEYATEFSQLQEIIRENDIVLVYSGYPLSLSGGKTPSTEAALDFAKRLQTAVSIPVRLVDERLTTVSATARMHSAGKNTRRQRSVIDQAAAVILLQDALDYEKRFGVSAGRSVLEGNV
ncbi:MAG: Holliday junction resolvase RuvX [Microbacteriaceae bacterium]|nr:Holliday junction resolvase RuvX [Microbacteriaceae bacterium]